MELIYHGPYSSVYKHHNHAIKVVDEDIKVPPHDIHREINLLQQLHHDNIIPIIKVEHKHEDILMYMPYYEQDLYGMMMNKSKKRTRFVEGEIQVINVNQIPESHIETIVDGIFQAIEYLHQHEIIHRDIKPHNFLMKDEITPIICDFSTAIHNCDHQLKVHDICSNYYKPLEVIFGLDYGLEVDIWSLGIMLTYLYSNNCQPALYPAETNDFNLIDAIFTTFGTPSLTKGINYWPQIFDVENFRLIKLNPKSRSQDIFPRCSNHQLVELYHSICNINSQERISINGIVNTWREIKYIKPKAI